MIKLINTYEFTDKLKKFVNLKKLRIKNCKSSLNENLFSWFNQLEELYFQSKDDKQSEIMNLIKRRNEIRSKIRFYCFNIEITKLDD